MEPPESSRFVLVVDDEPAVVTLVKVVLASRGYRVLTACGAAEALQFFSEAETQIDLVITDVLMPGLTGPELLLRIREISPAVKALLMSGHTAEEIVDPVAPLLGKPFSPRGLLAAVEDLLKSSPPREQVPRRPR